MNELEQNNNPGLDADQQDNLQDNPNTGADDGNDNDAQGNEKQKAGEEKGNDGKQQNEDVYGSPETFDYSDVQLPEGMQLDEELVKEFEPVAKKLNLSNKSANELMNLAVKLTEKNTAKFSEFAQELQQAKINSYQELLNTDKELNANNEVHYNQYLDTAIQGLKAVATPGFTELLKAEGLTHHPEFIKTFHKIGELCVSEKIPDAKYPTEQKEPDPADVLYGEN